jgi:two-component sensor histidine kinase
MGLMSALADQVGGEIEQSANPDGGTRYEVRLPLGRH